MESLVEVLDKTEDVALGLGKLSRSVNKRLRSFRYSYRKIIIFEFSFSRPMPTKRAPNSAQRHTTSCMHLRTVRHGGARAHGVGAVKLLA